MAEFLRNITCSTIAVVAGISFALRELDAVLFSNSFFFCRNQVDLWPLPSDEDDSDDRALQCALHNSLCDDPDKMKQVLPLGCILYNNAH